METRLRRIVLIGSGNVATHLGHGFEAAGQHICQVYSPTPGHAARLAATLTDCRAICGAAGIITDADFYIIATADSAVAAAAAAMPHVAGIVAHTSGSVAIDVLRPASERTAVLYPLQTFSRQSEVNLSEVPFFTEASDPDTLSEIDSLGRILSPHIHHADSRSRTTLHIAGVLSCNFPNYLWRLTSEILAADGYPLEVVRPLIQATLDKAMEIGPALAQTGPASRGDTGTVQRHTALLEGDAAKIYTLLSDAIMRATNK